MSGKAKRDIEKRTRQLLRRNILLVLKFLGLITAHPGVLKLTLKSNINGVSGSKALAPLATKVGSVVVLYRTVCGGTTQYSIREASRVLGTTLCDAVLPSVLGYCTRVIGVPH